MFLIQIKNYKIKVTIKTIAYTKLVIKFYNKIF